MSRSLLVLVGPTAAGKSRTATSVCRELGGEIISADSVQVYRGLNIGSAKPTDSEQAEIRHHCIDLIDPDARCDAVMWSKRADDAIADVRARGHVPVVVGGTGLYVRALLHGLIELPPIDETIRDEVRQLLAERGPEAVHAQLMREDPNMAQRLAPRDGQRIGRALEVLRQTGRSLSEWQDEHAFSPRRYEAKVFGLWPERDALYARIERRVMSMFEAGWVQEVEGLLDAGWSPQSPGLMTMGYRQIVEAIKGRVDRGALQDAVAQVHRRYARRQLVWFRGVSVKEDKLEHLDPASCDPVERLLEAALAS